ncbi:MAG TPA: GHMP kinase [Verrucomicrobiae bacterium]|nr:GHMP kinase [Verrucomicrobiae bacterium]
MIITRSPLRVSFLGGGSDFPSHFRVHGGAVLATAIDRYAYVTVAPLSGKFHGCRYKLSYSKVEVASSLDEIRHPAIREGIRLACPDAELEMHYVADLPAGTGLGSSSSFVVALLQALYGFRNRLVAMEQLARDAIRIERVELAEPGGVQDQILAAYGGFNLITFSGENDFEVQRIPLSQGRLQEIEDHCLLLYTGMTRNSGEVLMEQSRRNTDGSNANSLCSLADLARRGAEHIASDRPILDFGHLLHEGWLIKKQLAPLSLPQIDSIYEAALELGATGGKLLGAGRGGFLLVWAPAEKHAAIAEAAEQMTPLRIRVATSGATIIHASA